MHGAELAVISLPPETFLLMMPNNLDSMAKRAAEFYAAQAPPPHAGIYLVEPRPVDDMDRARALVLAAWRELGAVLLDVAALGVIGLRRVVLWCRQWRRVRSCVIAAVVHSVGA
jgi:hypothetical protein